MKKGFLKSRTFWFAALTFAGSFVPAVQSFMSENPETFGTIWGLATVVLRSVTKSKLVLSE
jgi:hypothetical protein